MAVRNQDEIMYIDSHDIYVFTVEDLETLEGGGVTVTWKLSWTPHSEAIIEKTSNNEQEISIDGKVFTVYIKPQDNKNLKPGEYYHEARVTTGQGITRPVASGTITVEPTLTSSGN